MAATGLLIAAALAVAQPATPTPASAARNAASPVASVPPAPPAVAPTPPAPPAACDARAWRHLVGRTLGDVLTMRLPPGTQVYRVGDPPPTREMVQGRLAVEIARTSRVRRVHCG